MRGGVAALELLEQGEHLVPAGGQELPGEEGGVEEEEGEEEDEGRVRGAGHGPDVVLAHVVGEVAPGGLGPLVLDLATIILANIQSMTQLNSTFFLVLLFIYFPVSSFKCFVSK